MAVKRALFSTTTIAVLLLLTLSITTAFPDHSLEHTTSKKDEQIKKLMASDAITLTIDEGYEIRRFIASFPSLRSLRLTMGQDADKEQALLFDCQQRLDAHLHGITLTLHRLQLQSYSNTPHLLLADTQALKAAADGAVELGSGEACHVDDKFVSSLLQRRLQDFSETIGDVIQLVTPVEPLKPIPPKLIPSGTGHGHGPHGLGQAKTQP